jgi:hypothetical protein
MLQSSRFVRVYPRVWRRAEYEMTDDDRRVAAGLALPPTAHLTGISRLQALGLNFGPRLPVRYVIQGPRHLAFKNVFLHRTKKLPPLDDDGVTVEAAFIFYCAGARVIDGIQVGDWLLHREHMDLARLSELAVEELWRPGSNEALWVKEHLDARCRSLKESETRAILEFAGLPKAEVNAEIDVGPDATLIADLVYREWGTFVEYEGSQHQEDRVQYRADLDRYALARDHGQRYIQVTHEHLARPRIAVHRVHRGLVKAGYDGPSPRFGYQWELLFAPLRVAVGPDDRWSAA